MDFRRFLTAVLTFGVASLLLNASAMTRRVEDAQPPMFATVVEAVGGFAERIGTDGLRTLAEDFSVRIGTGVERLDTSGDGDVYLFAGDSVMDDIAGWLAKVIDERTDGAAVSYEFIRKGSVAGDPKWGWEKDLPDEVRRTGADIVFLVLDVDSDDDAEREQMGEVLLDRILAAGAHQVVWIEHPVTLEREIEQERPRRRAALRRLDLRRDELIALDVSDALMNKTGGYTSHITTGSGKVVRIRQPDGIHFTDAGARIVATAVVDRLRI